MSETPCYKTEEEYRKSVQDNERLWQKSESVPVVSSGSTRCSHGGDNAVGNAARSHDRAFDKERAELWIAVYLKSDGMNYEPHYYANKALEQFDKRFGETAHAVGIKGGNSSE